MRTEEEEEEEEAAAVGELITLSAAFRSLVDGKEKNVMRMYFGMRS